jgi:GT2 family glycosyltransferase
LTLQSIKTLKESETNINFNIVVIENSTHYYSGVTNLKLNLEFNYNMFMNLGAKATNSDYIVFANNDLIFNKKWFSELLKYDFDCMSPRCPVDVRQQNINMDFISGYQVGNVFSGWCFVLKRKIWEQINGLDEDFKFWYADNATIEQLKTINVVPYLITNSIVEHLGSRTLTKETKELQHHLTGEQSRIFYEKYGRK